MVFADQRELSKIQSGLPNRDVQLCNPDILIKNIRNNKLPLLGREEHWGLKTNHHPEI